ncbi:hypothetical protein PHA51_11570 [Rodentibacter pneumotropicus]|uniref:hypothetical protein n=1 Tax=Rodentibacter pneumotropicus TaxID=758 RepID=UPI00232CC793|nr:hypothetical protein [Rodentibacter pneumotropicus]MDC2826648.1 hypothetical protein [Rodentibacter pneumotropicus]
MNKNVIYSLLLKKLISVLEKSNYSDSSIGKLIIKGSLILQNKYDNKTAKEKLSKKEIKDDAPNSLEELRIKNKNDFLKQKNKNAVLWFAIFLAPLIFLYFHFLGKVSNPSDVFFNFFTFLWALIIFKCYLIHTHTGVLTCPNCYYSSGKYYKMGQRKTGTTKEHFETYWSNGMFTRDTKTTHHYDVLAKCICCGHQYTFKQNK